MVNIEERYQYYLSTTSTTLCPRGLPGAQQHVAAAENMLACDMEDDACGPLPGLACKRTRAMGQAYWYKRAIDSSLNNRTLWSLRTSPLNVMRTLQCSNNAALVPIMRSSVGRMPDITGSFICWFDA